MDFPDGQNPRLRELTVLYCHQESGQAHTTESPNLSLSFHHCCVSGHTSAMGAAIVIADGR
jgi:hypothetical protein